jgi:hypothetical protein
MGEARELAGKIIAALREPTETMVKAITAPGADPGLIVNSWYRMIDAALEE